MILTWRAVLLKIQKLPRNLWRKQQKSSLQTTEKCLIKAAELIVEKITPGPTISPKRSKLSDDEHFGQTVARQLARLEEGEEKENLKLQIQVFNSQYVVWN